MGDPDFISIFASFVSREARRAVDWLAEVGRSATVEEIVAKIAEKRPDITEQKRMDGGLSAYSLRESLDLFARLGVVTREGDRYTLTDAAVKHFATATAMGCDDEEYAQAPEWLRKIIEER